MIKLDVRTDIASVRRQFRGLEGQIDRAAARALNRAATSVRSVATKEIARESGIRPQRAVRDRLRIRKATPKYLIAEVGIGAWTPNLARFMARQVKKGVSAAAWGKRKLYPRVFLANKGRTVFKRVGKERLPIEPVFGPKIHKTFLEQKVVEAMRAIGRSRFATEFAREVKRRTGTA